MVRARIALTLTLIVLGASAMNEVCNNIRSAVSTQLLTTTPLTLSTCELVDSYLSCLEQFPPAGPNAYMCPVNHICLFNAVAAVSFLDLHCTSLRVAAAETPCICLNGGSCPTTPGVCSCPSGFTGSKCETISTVADIIHVDLVLEGSCATVQAQGAQEYLDLLAIYSQMPSLAIHYNICSQSLDKQNVMILNFVVYITDPALVADTIVNIQGMVTQIGGTSPLLQVLNAVVTETENTPITIDCNQIPLGTAVADECGVCGGSNACLDCSGIPNGPFTLDSCGVCGGYANQISECNGLPSPSPWVTASTGPSGVPSYVPSFVSRRPSHGASFAPSRVPSSGPSGAPLDASPFVAITPSSLPQQSEDSDNQGDSDSETDTDSEGDSDNDDKNKKHGHMKVVAPVVAGFFGGAAALMYYCFRRRVAAAKARSRIPVVVMAAIVTPPTTTLVHVESTPVKLPQV